MEIYFPLVAEGCSSAGSGQAGGGWMEAKANGFCVLLEQKSSYLTAFAWGASSTWDALSTFERTILKQGKLGPSQESLKGYCMYSENENEAYIKKYYPLWE